MYAEGGLGMRLVNFPVATGGFGEGRSHSSQDVLS